MILSFGWSFTSSVSRKFLKVCRAIYCQPRWSIELWQTGEVKKFGDPLFQLSLSMKCEDQFRLNKDSIKGISRFKNGIRGKNSEDFSVLLRLVKCLKFRNLQTRGSVSQKENAGSNQRLPAKIEGFCLALQWQALAVLLAGFGFLLISVRYCEFQEPLKSPSMLSFKVHRHYTC